jgi:hypothetical protein
VTDVRDDVEELKREIAKLKKINMKLISRVERSYDQQPSAYALFETAIALEQSGPPPHGRGAAGAALGRAGERGFVARQR